MLEDTLKQILNIDCHLINHVDLWDVQLDGVDLDIKGMVLEALEYDFGLMTRGYFDNL